MAFSLDSKVKDILKSPAAAEILDKFCPGASKNPQMKLVGGLTLRKLASFPQSAYLQPHLVAFSFASSLFLFRTFVCPMMQFSRTDILLNRLKD